MGVVYAIAFASLAPQLPGLIGRQGLLPVTGVADWSDGAWQAAALGAAALALAPAAGFTRWWIFALLWALYYAADFLGQDFLSFQWDALLLEAGVQAVLLAWRACPRWLAAWLPRILLFRLMFSSGAVKLLSGDVTWRGLTAMQFHYETQPLPNPLSWYAHHLPDWFQTFSTGMTLGLELAVPLLIFTPWMARRVALVLLAGLQMLILLTGNFAFFNLLALALCVSLFNERQAWTPVPRWRQWPAIALGGVLIAGNVLQVAALLGAQTRPLLWLARYQVVNHYGLFAVMTTSRPEIVIEGSRDAIDWKEYEFRYKPGDVRRAPPVIAPYQPRLDWQMWFAALGSFRQNAWFPMLMQRLLEGSPPVLALLGRNPFADSPPKYVRARLYEYRFTTSAERRATGAWWHRELRGEYYPAVSLK